MKPPVLKTGVHFVDREFESRPLRQRSLAVSISKDSEIFFDGDVVIRNQFWSGYHTKLMRQLLLNRAAAKPRKGFLPFTDDGNFSRFTIAGRIQVDSWAIPFAIAV